MMVFVHFQCLKPAGMQYPSVGRLGHDLVVVVAVGDNPQMPVKLTEVQMERCLDDLEPI